MNAWKKCTDEMPDADTTVLIYMPGADGDPIWLGFFDGEEWLYVDAIPPKTEVTHWMHLPEPPQ